ncbi:RDD family protein [uncultured Demequina sp.]|uniref:RDD family protein n=1 Tax=uncultured Demequina sp. TaxID=693499 RepID=UPI0025F31884|nr:RDD family protein [uncultured Demequina sp.]
MPDAPTTPSAYLGRRMVGLGIDWLLCLLISAAFFPTEAAASGNAVERVVTGGDPLATLGIWAVQHLVLVATIGTTIGHRLLGLRVVRDDGAAFVGVAKAALRTILLALVIPAVVWDEERRGMHDRAAGTRLVATRGAARG